MTRQHINIGSNANDGTGDPLRTAFDKINDNFIEIYGTDDNANTLQSNLDVNGFNIVSTRSDEDIRIIPNGAGTIELEKSTNITGGLTVATTAAITGATTLSSTLNVTGLSTLASFKGATGATVTAVLDEDNMASNSDTALATQQSIKAYVDAQNVAQAITFVGDDSTGTAVNSGETFQILGGTGLTSAVTGDAITLDIDATVATLTGAQTLTNKILTSPTIGGHAVIEGVTPTGATGTGNLVFSAGPTLTGTLAAATITASGTLSVTGNTTISGSLTTTDITTTGNQTVTGNITAQGTVFSDKIKSPATNANLQIAAQGTGVVDIQSAMTTIGQTITGTASITGQFNADNIRIDGNTISSTDTNGNIEFTPNGSGQVNFNSARISAYQLNANTVALSEKIDTNKIASFTSNADIVIEPQGTGTVDFKVPAQSTVGSAGGASALPATPTGYFTIKVNGFTFVVPYYAQS
jgi:hypothetical protein